jgi:L-threonylcarbamoyladenylate synthase
MSEREPSTSTPVWRVNPRLPEKNIIECAASVIRKGGVIVYPTETFYGLGGDPTSEAAVQRIYRIKGRSREKPLPLIAADTEAARGFVADWPEAARCLAGELWPGPLTLVLPAKPVLAPQVVGSTGNIAIRVSSHPVARALAQAAGGLLISTSANLSEQPPISELREMSPDLISSVDGVLDAGLLTGGLPSTIVDVTSWPPKLLRPGCISWDSVSGALAGQH